jgi:hypothetical protein
MRGNRIWKVVPTPSWLVMSSVRVAYSTRARPLADPLAGAHPSEVRWQGCLERKAGKERFPGQEVGEYGAKHQQLAQLTRPQNPREPR